MFNVSPLLAFGWCSTLSTLSCAAVCVGLFIWCITRGSNAELRAAFYGRIEEMLCYHYSKSTDIPFTELHDRVKRMLTTCRVDSSLNELQHLQMQLLYSGDGVYTLRLILTYRTTQTQLEKGGICWTELPREIRNRELTNPQDTQTFDLAQ